MRLTILLFFLLPLSLFGQRIITDTTFKIPSNAFKIGEKLEYNVKIGFINGGKATLNIGLVPLGYSYVYHAKALITTQGIAKLYSVHDIYESYFSVSTCLPVMAIRNIKEGDYTRYNELRFDRDKNIVLSLKSGEHKTPKNILDILSMFYYSRSYLFQHVNHKDVIVLDMFFEDELYPLKIIFNGYDVVKTSYGKIRCMKFTPLVKTGGIVEKEDDIKIWFSADKSFVPIKIEVDMGLTKAKLELKRYSGLKQQLPFVDKKSEKKNRKEARKAKRKKN